MNSEKAHGDTDLIFAAQNGDGKCLKHQRRAGANVNSEGPLAFTPLYWAANKGHDKCLEMLITAGSYVSIQDHSGNSAPRNGYMSNV